MFIYYKNKKTGKVEAKYIGCDTQSTVFRNTDLYERFESEENIEIGTKVAATPKKQPWYKFWKR